MELLDKDACKNKNNDINPLTQWKWVAKPSDIKCYKKERNKERKKQFIRTRNLNSKPILAKSSPQPIIQLLKAYIGIQLNIKDVLFFSCFLFLENEYTMFPLEKTSEPEGISTSYFQWTFPLPNKWTNELTVQWCQRRVSLIYG